MKDFTNKIAVVTGGGTGMGRELVCQLISAGAHVAMCDVSEDNMAETYNLASKLGAGRLTSHRCDVSSEQDVLRAMKWRNSTKPNILTCYLTTRALLVVAA